MLAATSKIVEGFVYLFELDVHCSKIRDGGEIASDRRN